MQISKFQSALVFFSQFLPVGFYSRLIPWFRFHSCQSNNGKKINSQFIRNKSSAILSHEDGQQDFINPLGKALEYSCPEELTGFRLAQKWAEGSAGLQGREAPTSAFTLSNSQKPLDIATHPPIQPQIASKFVYEWRHWKTGRCQVSAKAANPNLTNTGRHYPWSCFPLWHSDYHTISKPKIHTIFSLMSLN